MSEPRDLVEESKTVAFDPAAFRFPRKGEVPKPKHKENRQERRARERREAKQR